MLKLKQVFTALGLAVLFFAGCVTVPQTGRSALHLMPSGQLASLSAEQFGRMKQEMAVSNDPRLNAMLQRVGERIAYVAAPDMPNANWEFVVFDNPQVNAFAMAGGKVGVFTGLFDLVQSEADLAVVVGHEIAHVAAGHANERVSQQMLAAGGALALRMGTEDMDPSDRRLLMAAYGATATAGVLLPFSRFHESEADEIGLMYAAEAGYDPRAAIPFWKRMAAQKSGSPPEFLSTHPSGETRIRRLEQLMPKALSVYRNR